MRGLEANARLFFTAVSSFSVQHASVRGVTERVSQGKASFARGLAETARLFTTSSELNTCPMLVAGISDNAAAVTASRFNLFFVFMFSLPVVAAILFAAGFQRLAAATLVDPPR